MSESQCCPVCDRAAIPPRWPFVRTTPWTDDCACSDYSHCMMHRYGDEQPPKRPSQEVMTARAQAAFERACEDHAHLLAQFADYEQLKAEVERLREENRKLLTCDCDGCEWHNPSEQGAKLRRQVAERQREACASWFVSNLESAAADAHAAYQREAHRRGDVRHADNYDDLPDATKEWDRVLCRWASDAVRAAPLVTEVDKP